MFEGDPVGTPTAGKVGGALAVITLTWALFFAPALLGPGQFLYRDAGRMHEPVKRWMAERLAKGELPEWNPYAGLGSPVVAGAVDAPLHPFTALLGALPPQAGYKAFVLALVLLAGLGAFAWARSLGLPLEAATLAGVAVLLSGFTVSSTDNPTFLASFAAAPLLFAAVTRAVQCGGPWPLALASLASYLCAASGDPQGWAIACGLGLVLAVALPALGAPALASRFRRALATSAALALGAAPVILPVALWLPHSSRPGALDGSETTRWNLVPLRVLEYALPHLVRGPFGVNPVFIAFDRTPNAGTPWLLSIYTGAPVVLLAARAAARDIRGRVLLLLAAILAWMALGPNGGFGQLAQHLPLWSRFRYWEKLAGWPSLLAAGAAAIALTRLLQDRAEARRTAWWAAVGAAVAGVTWSLFALAPGTVPAIAGGPRVAAAFAGNVTDGAMAAGLSLALCAAVAGLHSGARLPRLAGPALIAVVALDLAAANVRAYVLSPPEVADPERPLATALRKGSLERVVTPFAYEARRFPDLYPFESAWRFGTRSLMPGWNVSAHVGNVGPYTALPPGRLNRLWLDVPGPEMARRTGLFGARYAVVTGRPEDARKAGFSPPFKVFATDPVLPAFLVPIPSRPRAYIAGRVEQVDEAGAFAFARHGEIASELSVVEAPIPTGVGAAPNGTVRFTRDEPERVEFEVENGAAALLVLNDSPAPGWTARVDGRLVEIVVANFAARGVWLDPGRHHVAFRYRTPGLAAGALSLLAFLAGLAGWGSVRARRRAPGPAARLDLL